MVKKIKFPLELNNGIAARTLEELQENFDLEKVIAYFKSGKLLRWLEDRYYEEEAEQIEQLNEEEACFPQRLCDIFHVEYSATEEIDVDGLVRKQEKLKKLKQFTDNIEILESAELAAFNQEDLAELLDDGHEKIFLCNNRFVIPLKRGNCHYIGIEHAAAILKGKTRIDLDASNIVLENVEVICPESKDVNMKLSKNITGDVIKKCYEVTLKIIHTYYKNIDNGKSYIFPEMVEDSWPTGDNKIALYRIDKETQEECFVDLIYDILEGICSDGKHRYMLSCDFYDYERIEDCLNGCNSKYWRNGEDIYYLKNTLWDLNGDYCDKLFYPSLDRCLEEKEYNGIFKLSVSDMKIRQLWSEEEMVACLPFQTNRIEFKEIFWATDTDIIVKIKKMDDRFLGLNSKGSSLLCVRTDKKDVYVIDDLDFFGDHWPQIEKVFADSKRLIYVNPEKKEIIEYNIKTKCKRRFAENVVSIKRDGSGVVIKNDHIYYVICEPGDKPGFTTGRHFLVKKDINTQEEDRHTLPQYPVPSDGRGGYRYDMAFFEEKEDGLYLIHFTMGGPRHTMRLE